MATILAVLKKRGLSITALRELKTALHTTMYQDVSVLDFLILLCQRQHLDDAPMENAPYLVIDGENRISVASARDLAAMATMPEIATYSQLVLNMRFVLQDCDFIYKINASAPAEFLELPTIIADRFYNPAVKELRINKNKQQIETLSDGGPDPEYGERVIKYRHGDITSDLVKAKEGLD